jgi:hypothetical protein
LPDLLEYQLSELFETMLTSLCGTPADSKALTAWLAVA